ncbi:MAG: recombinase family protein [Acetobacter sp.]|nr:recombinase family protein [Acetobacter sp.]
MSNTIYGYARVSTVRQDVNRQIKNIKDKYPDAIIFAEEYTGTRITRPEFSKLLKIVKSGDVIVFDEVSRMSRDAEEGFKLYEELYNKGVRLIFLKEPHLDTDTYRETLKSNISMTGTELDYILEGVQKYMMALAKKQIALAFEQAQKEVEYLHRRTSEGVKRAIANGSKCGGLTTKGTKLVTKKSISMKASIKKLSRDFDGSNTDVEVIKILGISRKTYYKYKKEMLAD